MPAISLRVVGPGNRGNKQNRLDTLVSMNQNFHKGPAKTWVSAMEDQPPKSSRSEVMRVLPSLFNPSREPTFEGHFSRKEVLSDQDEPARAPGHSRLSSRIWPA